MALPYVDELLNKKLTRKEFLGYVGALALGVVGVIAIKNSLSQIPKQALPDNLAKRPDSSRASGGYGSSLYSVKG